MMRNCAFLGLGLLLLLTGFQDPERQERLNVSHEVNSKTVPRYEVLEITFTHENAYPNPFLDASVDVTFFSPSDRVHKVGGFHYGSDEKPEIEVKQHGREGQIVKYAFKKQNLWKARFAPAEVGKWLYSYEFTDHKGRRASGQGTFTCVEGRRPSPGFVRIHPRNPFRLVFDDGSPYFPIGLQDGWGDGSANGTMLDQTSMEGPFRLNRRGFPEPPPGALYKPGPSSNPQNADVYFRRFGRCGFNLFRYSQKNCTPALLQTWDQYLVQEAVMVDELLRCARKYGFRIFYGLFGFHPAFNRHPRDKEAMEKVKRFVKYSVDRWGAYVDFWELLNEQHADDGWYGIMIPYLRSIDPYRHPITTSWERPRLEGIELNAPHWYQNEDELQSDSVTSGRARAWKKHGKPVIVGEQGNWTDPKKRKPGIGGVWDDRSAVRMRIRNWTAFFHEIAFIFWDTSYSKDGHFMNIWLGPREREYVRAMQAFAYALDPDVRMVDATVSDSRAVRAYGLASKSRAGVYLHHFADHKDPVRGLKVTLDVPSAGKAYWYSTETAAILGVEDAPAGSRTFTAPDFTVDLALLVTADGPPDIDRDGKSNDVDPDDDNDSVPDEKDAFPLDPEEWEDRDGDMIGDNLDADIDADGVGDDRNENSTADHEELDIDGDGVDRCGSIPWDAFPLDPKEWRDTDGDGIGDNADTDDDGDGWSDEEEKRAGTDPRDKLSFPAP